MNYAKYSRSRRDFVFKFVFANPFDEIIELLEAMRRLDIKPEHECFDLGHVASLEPLVDMGLLEAPLHADFVMGVLGGVPATARNLAAMADNLPAGVASHWGVIGIGRDAVVDGGRRADPRRLDPGRPGGQLLPARRDHGPLERRADRQGPPAHRGLRSPAGDGRRGAGAARHHPRPGARMSPLPLDGLRVLDLSRLLPGGFCSLMLADFGAEVIKVEDTGMGDYVRWAPPYYEGAEDSAKSALFLSLNRGKRSIRLDLKSEAGRDVLLRLVRDADVLLESFRPGVLDRLGVGYERLRQENPGLVYCAITGYGQNGPNRDRSGHDMNYLGLNGRARADRRGRRSAGAGGGPDRRSRRRRADGRGGDPRRAARARALGRGPARRLLDVRRIAVVAGDGRRGGARRRGDASARAA